MIDSREACESNRRRRPFTSRRQYGPVEELADPAAAEAGVRRGQRVRLAVEYTLLFVGAVVGYTLAGSPGSPIPVLLMMAGLAAWYLRRRPDFDQAAFWRAAGLRGQLPGMLALWAVAVAVTLAGLAVFAGRGLVAASAAAFGCAHIIFGNALSVVLTLAGGALFATRYRRTGSLFAASVEHALYGLLVFTAGLGEYFYHGA